MKKTNIVYLSIMMILYNPLLNGMSNLTYKPLPSITVANSTENPLTVTVAFGYYKKIPGLFGQRIFGPRMFMPVNKKLRKIIQPEDSFTFSATFLLTVLKHQKKTKWEKALKKAEGVNHIKIYKDLEDFTILFLQKADRNAQKITIYQDDTSFTFRRDV